MQSVVAQRGSVPKCRFPNCRAPSTSHDANLHPGCIKLLWWSDRHRGGPMLGTYNRGTGSAYRLRNLGSIVLKMWQGPRRLICAITANTFKAMPRLCQADYRLTFCVTLREYSNRLGHTSQKPLILTFIPRWNPKVFLNHNWRSNNFKEPLLRLDIFGNGHLNPGISSSFLGCGFDGWSQGIHERCNV